MRLFLWTALYSLLLSSVTWAHSISKDAFHIGILLYDDAQTIDYAGPYEVFGQANYRLTTISENGETITSAMGLQVVPDTSFDQESQFDAVIIPGGGINKAMENPKILRWIKEQSEQVQYVLTVCNGAFILANTGLLDGKKATTIRGAFNSFESSFPDIELVKDKKFVDNGQLITTAGLSSGIDGALYLVSKVDTMEKAKSVAAKIEYQWRPQGGYIRGMMADRIMPDLGDLPGSIQFVSEEYSYGSLEDWYSAFQLSADINAVKNWLNEQMIEKSKWKKDLKKSNANRWVYHSIDEHAEFQVDFVSPSKSQPWVIKLSILAQPS
ncbi:DJ-1/PfpI family protein [Microbulbifer epialgicus]|uniref:DJ-1/PfpI family protein n=1 Tax=Microbulbifer epialgicus TaxID=393907 RepID=A0ABV4NWB6_9GAMM